MSQINLEKSQASPAPERIQLQTADLTQANAAKLAELFPSVVTECRDASGRLRKVVNYDALRALLGDGAEGGKEHYEFTWVGKRAAAAAAAAPTAKTLRPCPAESLDWERTENLYIEGDNLDVLKLLQQGYLGRIKMIYIDPPYNTGNDFIYVDDFAKSRAEYEEESGEVVLDDEGGRIRLFKNTDANGRFHSDWCSMMYPRLMLARNLLSDDGVIFISCDDNEQENVKKMCDEIFGRENFIAQLIWEKKKKGSFLSDDVTTIKDYIITYAREKNNFPGLIGEIKEDQETYPCINAINKRDIRIIPAGIKSKFKKKDYLLPKGSRISVNTMDLILLSDLEIRGGVLTKELVIEGNWRFSQEAMSKFAEDGELYLTQDLYLRRIVSEPRLKVVKDILFRVGDDESLDHKASINLKNLFDSGWGSNEDADEELRNLFGIGGVMSYPKPTRLIFKLIASYRNNDDFIILDFFSGSATTAHAVMQLNAEDGGKRRFIMIQLPEPCGADSEAAKAGYATICEIGKERIRRAGARIKAEKGLSAQNLDSGFRVLKCASSNFKDVAATPEDTGQAGLLDKVDNVKPERTALDLLFGAAIALELPLSLPHASEIIGGCEVHSYGGNELLACFDANVSEEAARAMAGRRPARAVFRDGSFAESPGRINVLEIFKSDSPSTRLRII